MMGLEPTRANAHMTLNHACLPIPTHLRNNNTLMIARFYIVVKLKMGGLIKMEKYDGEFSGLGMILGVLIGLAFGRFAWFYARNHLWNCNGLGSESME